MIERLKIIWRKIQGELNPTGFKSTERITLYRLFSFIFSKNGLQRLGRVLIKSFNVFIRIVTGKRGMAPTYSKWLKKYLSEKTSESELIDTIKSWHVMPLISIVMPVYNADLQFLKEAVNSVKKQIYTNWELCISDDYSTAEVRSCLEEIASTDKKIKVHYRNTNGNISENANSAASLASGEYLAFLDQDDLLATDALFQIVKLLQGEGKHADIIYSDEDKINDKGERSSPFFKPQWSPHSILTRNYINHFFCIKNQLFDELDGFKKGFEGAQDHDLILRASDLTKNILHIPEILYHWRVHSKSTAQNPDSKKWAFKAGEKAVEEAIARKGFNTTVQTIDSIPGNYKLDIELHNKPKVSVIIPSKDKPEVLEVCLKSIFNKTDYSNFEIIIIDNNSSQQETFNLYNRYKSLHPKQFRVEEFKESFNFSRMQNYGAKKATGEYLLLLNNDTEVIMSDWLDKMLSFAQLPDAGAVGVKLFFPNNKLQHVGVVLGIRGIVGHVYVGSDGHHPGYFQSNNVVTNYSAVTAACLMIKKDTFIKVGGFDEQLAIEYNDVDFCLKLYSAGYYNIYVPDIQLLHYESLTRGHPSRTRESHKQSMQEGDYFSTKWRKLIDNDPFYNKNLSKQYTEFQYDV